MSEEIKKTIYYWYLPDETMKMITYCKPSIFRRFFMWVVLRAEFGVDYYESEQDEAN